MANFHSSKKKKLIIPISASLLTVLEEKTLGGGPFSLTWSLLYELLAVPSGGGRGRPGAEALRMAWGNSVLLLASFSRAVKRDVQQRWSQRASLPQISCLCALPGGRSETQRASLYSPHPLKQPLSDSSPSWLRNHDPARALCRRIYPHALWVHVNKFPQTTAVASGTHSGFCILLFSFF